MMRSHNSSPQISPKRREFLNIIREAEDARLPRVVIQKLSAMTYAAEPVPLFAKNILQKLTELEKGGKLTSRDNERYIEAFRCVPASPSRPPFDILAHCLWHSEGIEEKSEGSMSPKLMVEASILSIGEVCARKARKALLSLKREIPQEADDE